MDLVLEDAGLSTLDRSLEQATGASLGVSCAGPRQVIGDGSPFVLGVAPDRRRDPTLRYWLEIRKVALVSAIVPSSVDVIRIW